MIDEPMAGPGKAPGMRLAFLRPRAADFDPRRSRTVGRLRLLLPLGAVLVLALLVLWPKLQPNKIEPAVLKKIPNLVIQNVHFTGLDSKEEPYSLTATRATRPAGLRNIYDFDKPEAEVTLANGTWISGHANYGRYDPDTRRLWLGGDVEVFHDQGYQFTSSEAQVDLNDNDAWGEKPVLIQGRFGTVRGEGFRLLDGGNDMVVTGPARADLDLRPQPSSDKPSAAH